MSPKPQSNQTKQSLDNGTFYSFISLEFLFYCSIAVGSYANVFLQELGYNASSVGYMNAVGSAISIFSISMWGMASDKLRSIRKVVMICTIGLIAAQIVVPMSAGIKIASLSLAFIIIPLSSLFRNPSLLLLDNWAVKSANERGFNYGFVRGMGSLGYALVSLLMGAILPKIGVASTFYIGPVILAVFFFICLRMKSDTPKSDDINKKTLSFKEMKISRLFTNYRYVTYVLFSVGIHLAINGARLFLPYLISSVGESSARLGLVGGFTAAIEIPVLLFFAQFLRKKFPLQYIAIGASVFLGLEVLCFAFAGNLWQIVLFSSFQGLGNGLLFAVSSNYIFTLAPPELKATAQTLNGSLGAISGIFGNVMGGILIDSMGISSFYLVCAAIIFGITALYIASYIFGSKVLKIASTPANN